MRFRKNERSISQEEQIESSLLRGESITPLDALKKYGAIIFNLRKKGHNIRTDMVDNGYRKYASYKIENR